MSWYDYLIIYLTSSLTLVMIIMSYNNLIKSKLELNKKLLLVSSIGGVFITLNIYNSEPIFKLFISFMIIFVSTVLTNNENVSKVFVNVVICFLLMLFWEVVTSAAVVLLKIGDMNTFDQSTILKSIMSFINLTFVYMVTSRKRVIGFASKISNKVKDNRLIISVLVLSIIILIIADVKYFESFSKDTYYSNLIIFVCIMIIIIIMIYNNYKTSKEIEKTEVLLSFMNKYEKTIDQNRIDRHELLNELLILKSYKNKNTKGFNQSLDTLINNYNNKGFKTKNINNLPSGLRGIIYYKLYGLDEKGFDININVSKVIDKAIDNVDQNNYISLNKILGVVLDNAIEASDKTKEKLLLIDIFLEENDIVFEISNTFLGKVDLDKINNKNYSTKGKNRGIGLFMVKELIKKNNDILINQSVTDNIFTTKIMLRKK